MSKQAFELLDFESGYRYALETATDILPSDFTLVLPEKNGTIALVKDIEDLNSKLVRGDVVVGDSKKLDGKSVSEFALSDLSNINFDPQTIETLRGYTGSKGDNGATGPQGISYNNEEPIIGTKEIKVTMSNNNIDLKTGNLFTKTISTATTFTVSNVVPSGQTNSFILELTNAGSQMITWWPGMKWTGGTTPVLTVNGVDILGFYTHDGGTTWRGILMSKDSK